MTKKEPKTCFVICPIGEDETEARRRSDQVLNEIIKPAVEQCGYERTVRGDEIGEPGVITRQLIEHIYKADLVIADLTDHNPNVFYELAFRHTIKRPVIMIMHVSQKPPFDVAQSRFIKYDHHDLTIARECKEEIIKQIRFIEENPDKVDSPISIAVDFEQLRDSEHLLGKSLSTIMDKLDEIRSMLDVDLDVDLSPYAWVYQPSHIGADITLPAYSIAYPSSLFSSHPPLLSMQNLARLKAALGPEKFDNLVASHLLLSREQVDEINSLQLTMSDDIHHDSASEDEKPDDNSR